MSPLFVIFFTVFIDMVGFGIVIPVLPLYAEHFSIGKTAGSKPRSASPKARKHVTSGSI
jgi:MFS family permease